jgi:hypothetical protein
VAEFLSPAWLALVGEAVSGSRALAGLAAPGPVVVEHVVSGTPHGEVRYCLVCDSAGARLDLGGHAEPGGAARIVVECDYATACALAQGTANAQSALASGSWTVRGDLAALAARRDALAVLDDVFVAIRAATTYPPVEP